MPPRVAIIAFSRGDSLHVSAAAFSAAAFSAAAFSAAAFSDSSFFRQQQASAKNGFPRAALVIECCDQHAVPAPHPEIDAVLAVSLQHRSGDDVIRINVLWLCGCRHRFDLFYRLTDFCSEIRRGLRHDITAIACHKGRLNARAVFINNVCVADNVVHSHSHAFSGKRRETRRKKKKRNAPVKIKIADLRQDRKRRIIKHDASIRVVKRLVVSARIKWSDDTARIDTILLARPGADSIINDRRRVAVVRRLFWLKFCDKIVVLWVVGKKRRL